MRAFSRGLYELLLTEGLAEEVALLAQGLSPRSTPLRSAEAADRIALHIGRLVRSALEDQEDKTRVVKALDLARVLVAQISRHSSDPSLIRESPDASGYVLRAIEARLPDGTSEEVDAPLIPLLDTTLLTNAPGEPNVGSQLLAEIDSADRIDGIVAFIRFSGIRPLLGRLTRHCAAGRKLRILTTTYTDSTELGALELLRDAGAEIRVSYNTANTRLHAKAWLFSRASGFSTAYVGSSNLTHSAQVTGLEWNVRLSGARNPDAIKKIESVFEAYWNAPEFVPFDADEFITRTAQSASTGATALSPLEVRLEPFQERLLEQVAVSRSRGYSRNLLVSATGTGKTVMAAVDYKRLRGTLTRDRLLFVAHRERLLEQSLATFRNVLREPAFGELWVGRNRPARFDHVFASIQSLAASGIEQIDPDQYDIVIIDEFHHAAAQSYDSLLSHLRPDQLLAASIHEG